MCYGRNGDDGMYYAPCPFNIKSMQQCTRNSSVLVPVCDVRYTVSVVLLRENR